MPKLPGFIGQSYLMDARTFDVQRTINLYPIASESTTSKSIAALRKVPGYTLYANVGGGPIRGTIEADGRCFWVSGSEFYEVDTAGIAAKRGDLLTSTPRCTVHYNGTQIMVVDGTYGYIFDMSANTFTQITDPDFPNPAAFGGFQDNYFFVVKGGTAQFYISALGDGTSWDALDFTTIESSPDDLVGAVSDGTNVWMLGRTSVEVYQNTGNAGFPFERVQGAVIPSGCSSPHTAIVFDNALTWLGQDDKGGAIVWRANGYQAERVSTQAIERLIALSTNPVESYAYTYYEQGHAFYILQVKGIDTTLCCDASVAYAWHERQFLDTNINQYQQHRGSCHVYFNNKNYIGDALLGKVYEQDLSIFDFDGAPIVWERTSPHYQDEKKPVQYGVFELDMEVGRGLVTGQGSDPQVMMQYSNDGGWTWSAERWRSCGAQGKYKARVRWHRCGTGIDRVWRVRGSDPVFIQINEAYVNNA